MRRANNPELIMVNTTPIGINLGFDFCAEHEQGISGIMLSFGIKTDKIGFEARKITQLPTNLVLVEKQYQVILCLSRYDNINTLLKSTLKIYEFDKSNIASAWDNESFAINAMGKENSKFMKELIEAFKQKDIVFIMSKGTPFGGAGLCILIYSKIPEDIKLAFAKEDKQIKDEIKLCKKLEEKSGIKDLLTKKGKRWYTLSINRIDNGQPMWWLNPQEQSKYKAGWFTTQDLIDWADDKGKIIISENEK
ncbi:MAG: hypothetical protein ACYCS1_05250 [Gammaproteobacteria bacterium]